MRIVRQTLYRPHSLKLGANIPLIMDWKEDVIRA